MRTASFHCPVFFLAAFFAGLPGVTLGDVVINEIHYDPPDKTLLEEFVELHNAGDRAVDLSGWYFSDGVSYTFPAGTVLAAGEHLAVAEDPAALVRKFGPSRALGPFDGHLSNDGERVILRDSKGVKVDEVDYSVGFPWPVAPAGRGGSLELVSPSLDNDLGGSWRPSGPPRSLPSARIPFISAQDPGWRYRKGLSEASDPPAAWRQDTFVEDDTWLTGKTPIGFADGDDLTVLDDMLGNYTSVYLRHPFTIAAPGDISRWLRLRLYVDDGCVVWINGVEVARAHVAAGEKAYNGVALNNEAKWEEFLLSGSAAYLRAGTNMLAIHALNQSLSSNDFSIDAELFIPARDEIAPAPTPGGENSVLGPGAPPQMRQVRHSPQEPRSGEAISITAKVTDPDGVAAVSFRYLVVRPGSYVPSHLALDPATLMARPDQERLPNPAFEDPANWTEAAMLDDGAGPDVQAGDGIYSGVIPPQPNRALVRYRITAADAASGAITAPYSDDRSLNFACFVYDGVPPYQASKVSVHPEGRGHIYPPEVLTSLPVYHLITRSTEVAHCVAYNGAWQIPKSNERARDVFNWEGAFVYDGVVYDHVHYRLRQANDRYGGAGKRSWRIRFQKGNYLRARDNMGREYPTRWRTLNTGKMFDNKAVGNFGLTETMNAILWNLTGTPAPHFNTFHFRVVDAAEESPAGVNGQYLGDFWGMASGIEDYDPRFLDAHGLPDGNLYKLKDGIFDGNQLRRNQGRRSVTTDEDFQNIRRSLRPDKAPDWLDTHVNYPAWYPYHVVVEAIRHYDFVPADSHSKNRAWFFEPAEGSRLGRLWTLPHDSDASWGPSWNDGIDYSKQAIAAGAAKAEYRIEYRNFIREFRDLVWNEEALNPMIDGLAAIIGEFSRADRDRWRAAPPEAGSQDFGALEQKVLDMKRFAFVAWTGGSGPTVPAGGRAKHLDNLAAAEGDATRIPQTPAVVASGPAHFPLDGLTFETSPFADPQGNETFGALKWRLAEVRGRGAGPYDPTAEGLHEWKAVWESDLLSEFRSKVTVPPGELMPGHTYRIRSRVMDNTGRSSHWSPPVEFTASEPDRSSPLEDHLRITEIMYHPAEGGDLEFLEVQNIGPAPLDLTLARFTEGIVFAFAGSAVTTLGPGEHAVVVKDRVLFEARYAGKPVAIAGEYEGKLDNEGDAIALVHGEDQTILRFAYDDSWYPDTDGGGFSLVIAHPRWPRDRWTLKEGWRPSRLPWGSPGEADGDAPAGLVLAGDINQDLSLDVSDAIWIFLHLLTGNQAPLPCSEEGNLALLDLDGDRVPTITDGIHLLGFLFLSGPPPVLGRGCVPVEGCPSSCALQ